ncbi:GVQW3 [Cordylochernes scorpioides]|uniref:GVQW3 n=1 Tax=Cordylochernes scorpioides TaxID=51811 RepID=A0ABY6LBJ6_9ARAC|nr:GVQW3 [Cordylochernes scorpioides]
MKLGLKQCFPTLQSFPQKSKFRAPRDALGKKGHICKGMKIDGREKNNTCEDSRREFLRANRVSRYLASEPKSATDTYELIKEAFGDAVLSHSRTFEWFSRFLKGREKVNDDQHTGRPRSLGCEKNKLKIKELIKSNRRISIKD